MSNWPSGKVSCPVPGAYSTGTITISTTASNWASLTNTILVSNGSGSSNFSTSVSSNHPSLHVTGKANFDNDVTVKGISLIETLEKINERLAILVPDPEKVKEFEALKKAYDNYKLLEALCYKDKK
jgi:hypothetical protein